MITEEQALARILENVGSLPARRVPLIQAREQFAAADVLARVALPRFDNSAMDGYAVVAASCADGKPQRLIGEQPAGMDRGLQIKAGETIRVFTGAPIPAGADAVVMQEDVRAESAEIFVNTKVESGEFIRRRGCDLSEGQKILEAGTRIRSQTLALLASQGFAEVEVGGEVRAAIVSTGDELVAPGEKLGPGHIFDSNSVLLQGLVEKCGASVGNVRHCPDDASSIESALLAGDVNNDGDRPHYVRGQFSNGKFSAIGRQESHALYGLSRANGLLRVPSGESFRGGDTVPVIPLD